MRAVERTPWAERRSSRHDEIVATIARDPRALMHYLPCANVRLDRLTVEAPCGRGFCDMLLETHGRQTAWFVEVKTDAEHASGGDIARQLQWYAAQRSGYTLKRLVCVPESPLDRNSATVLGHAGVIVVPFCEIWDISRDVAAGGGRY
jgi:hypothetical protein